MIPDIRNFYGIYVDLEGMPTKAKVEENAAAAARTSATRAAQNTRNETNRNYDKRAFDAKEKQQTAHQDLETQLQTITRSAASNGSIPNENSLGTGRSPDFAAAKVLDRRLAKAVNDKRKLDLELQHLQQQLAREQDQSKAKAADVITFALAGIGMALAVLVGTNFLSAIVMIAAVTVVQVRLSRGPSALVNRQVARRPEISVNRRMKSGISRVVGGWLIVLTVATAAITSVVLLGSYPLVSTGIFWSWISGAAPTVPVTLVSNLFFWGTAAYGAFLVITGYRRRAGG